MAGQSYPMGRILYMIIWPITRPVVNGLRSKAERSPWFRDYVCIPVARAYHRLADKVKQWEDGTNFEYKKLDAEKAVEVGTNLLAEAMFFGISVTLVSLEYLRQRRKKQSTALDQSSDLMLSDTIVRNMFFLSEKRNVMIRKLRREIKAMTVKVEAIEKKNRSYFEVFKILPKLPLFKKSPSPAPTPSIIVKAINYVQNDVMQL